MAIDTHIKFDGIDGEATHQDHKGEIEVMSWSWNITNVSNLTGGGSGQGKATAGDFHFMHQYDKASPNLAKKCAKGEHFPTVVLTARKSGDGQKDFLKVTMKDGKVHEGESRYPLGHPWFGAHECAHRLHRGLCHRPWQRTPYGQPGLWHSSAWCHWRSTCRYGL